MQLNIHTSIHDKLEYFYKVHKIPNIIFHGPSGSGKRTIVNKFINTIYNFDKERIKTFVMYVNCAHGKGIKFIREELKFFAKTHINSNGGDIFKSIVLLNADKLTMDAQSALRRCIELFSHTTRFFIIVEDKYKLLKPILSRFCEIYVPEPTYNGSTINLYKHNLRETFKLDDVKTQRVEWLKKELDKSITKNLSDSKLMQISTKLYEKGYSGLDIINLLENHNHFKNLKNEKRYELLIAFNKVRKEFRNEKILIMFILNFLFLSLDYSLENISFM
jgi:DNA polymerase III delta prime subunit|uniref:AAA+ ATPase domain-containing protein n=1 Tax=viral metagenome TaxID=1070528 RepID=A0A6C0DSQ7_9ZZZZ